jgi:hypothetical protein
MCDFFFAKGRHAIRGWAGLLQPTLLLHWPENAYAINAVERRLLMLPPMQWNSLVSVLLIMYIVNLSPTSKIEKLLDANLARYFRSKESKFTLHVGFSIYSLWRSLVGELSHAFVVLLLAGTIR